MSEAAGFGAFLWGHRNAAHRAVPTEVRPADLRLAEVRPAELLPIVVSEGNSYRSLDASIVVLAHFDGNVWLPAGAPLEIERFVGIPGRSARRG